MNESSYTAGLEILDKVLRELRARRPRLDARRKIMLAASGSDTPIRYRMTSKALDDPLRSLKELCEKQYTYEGSSHVCTLMRYGIVMLRGYSFSH